MSSPQRTILIVDDFASVRLYHSSFLTRKGYHCVGVPGGTEAFATLRSQHVDLILLDLVMPGMGGDAFLQQLAADPQFSRLPVLIISSEQAKHDHRAANGRPVRLLTKPVLPSDLLQCVNDLLPAASAPAAAVSESTSEAVA